MTAAKGRRFTKMHGLGNDCVLLDTRAQPWPDLAAWVPWLADRRLGVGCDQVVVIAPAVGATARARLDFFNADGSVAEACGNGSRCAAAFLAAEAPPLEMLLETAGGVLRAGVEPQTTQVRLTFPPPRLKAEEIPLAKEISLCRQELRLEGLEGPFFVNVGNPHLVYFLTHAADVAAYDLARQGARLERHPLLPQRANISLAAPSATDHLTLRVWERGAGLTAACGSAALATCVAAVELGLCARQAMVTQDGGTLTVRWCDDHSLEMIGATALSFSGELPQARPLATAPGKLAPGKQATTLGGL